MRTKKMMEFSGIVPGNYSFSLVLIPDFPESMPLPWYSLNPTVNGL